MRSAALLSLALLYCQMDTWEMVDLNNVVVAAVTNVAKALDIWLELVEAC